jgi:hypothetical protein
MYTYEVVVAEKKLHNKNFEKEIWHNNESSHKRPSKSCS